MKIAKFAIACLSAGLIFTTLNLPVTTAVQFPNGRVAFDKSPLLRSTVTTFNGVRVWGARYYFTIELPADAGESLQQVVIDQRTGGEDIDFYLSKTVAYHGTHRRKQAKLTIDSISQNEKTQAITVTLAEPIPPGTTFTIGLKPKRNPDLGGVYLFGVTAFPRGEKPDGLYLGAGRLHFYQGDDGFFDH